MGHFGFGYNDFAAGGAPATAGESFYNNFTSSGVGSPYTAVTAGTDTLWAPTAVLSPTRIINMWHNGTNVACELVSVSGSTLANVDGPSNAGTASGGQVGICAISSTKALVTYDGTSGVGKARIIDASGDTVSFGTEFEFDAGTAQYNTPIRISDTKAVVVYRDASASSYPEYQQLDISGTTITGNTPVTLESAACAWTGGQFTDTDKFVACWTRTAATVAQKAAAVSLPSTVGTVTTVSSLSSSGGQTIAMAYDSSNWDSSITKMAVGFTDNGTTRMRIGTVSGTTITWGTEATIPQGHDSNDSSATVAMFSDEYGAVTIREGGSTDYRIHVTPFTVSGTTVTFASTTVEVFNPAQTGTDSITRPMGGICIVDTDKCLVSVRIEDVASTYKRDYRILTDT